MTLDIGENVVDATGFAIFAVETRAAPNYVVAFVVILFYEFVEFDNRIFGFFEKIDKNSKFAKNQTVLKILLHVRYKVTTI